MSGLRTLVGLVGSRSGVKKSIRLLLPLSYLPEDDLSFYCSPTLTNSYEVPTLLKERGTNLKKGLFEVGESRYKIQKRLRWNSDCVSECISSMEYSYNSS